MNPSSIRDDKIVWLSKAAALGEGLKGQRTPPLLSKLVRGMLKIREIVSEFVELQSDRVEFQLVRSVSLGR